MRSVIRDFFFPVLERKKKKPTHESVILKKKLLEVSFRSSLTLLIRLYGTNLENL